MKFSGRIFAKLIPNHLQHNGHCFYHPMMCYSAGELSVFSSPVHCIWLFLNSCRFSSFLFLPSSFLQELWCYSDELLAFWSFFKGFIYISCSRYQNIIFLLFFFFLSFLNCLNLTITPLLPVQTVRHFRSLVKYFRINSIDSFVTLYFMISQ